MTQDADLSVFCAPLTLVPSGVLVPSPCPPSFQTHPGRQPGGGGTGAEPGACFPQGLGETSEL